MPGRGWAVDWPVMGRALMLDGRTCCWEPGAAWLPAPPDGRVGRIGPPGMDWKLAVNVT